MMTYFGLQSKVPGLGRFDSDEGAVPYLGEDVTVGGLPTGEVDGASMPSASSGGCC